MLTELSRFHETMSGTHPLTACMTQRQVIQAMKSPLLGQCVIPVTEAAAAAPLSTVIGISHLPTVSGEVQTYTGEQHYYTAISSRTLIQPTSQYMTGPYSSATQELLFLLLPR